MPVDFSHIALPIMEIVPQLREQLAVHTTVIVSSPPGAGKSTIVPLALLDEPWLQGRKIIMLEPRRLAASTIAHRMAALLGEKAGDTVGYRVRFDEFHERRLHTDLSMALCRESQQVLRPDLRMLIMSATLDSGALADLLDAPVMESQGRMYPINIIHTEDARPEELAGQCARTIIRAWREQQGDILAFLPGEAEIRACAERLLAHPIGAPVPPLSGQRPLAAQHAAIQPDRHGQRKIVLATSIAETSLTIEGISVVVDCGYTRTMVYDPPSGLSRLRTERISRDAADQRAGRAGRLGPGTCYRMWSRATEQRMADFRTPEILQADLTQLVLDMAKWGVQDAAQLDWLTLPPTGSTARAGDLLHALGALQEGKITPHGHDIHALPCHPRLAHMLLASKTINQPGLATDLAALLEERDPLGREVGVDVNLRIEALRRHRAYGKQGKRFDNLEKIARSYRKLLGTDAANGIADTHATGLLLSYAYPERIAKALNDGRCTFQLANGKRATVAPGDDLAHAAWLAVASLDAREGLGKIFLASA